MEIAYKYAESTVKPAAIEASEKTIYLRKDFASVIRESEQSDETTYWTYQEAALTFDEFNAYTSFLMAENAINGTNDSANIIQLIAGQENGDMNQLAIMGAIADLYDMLASMSV